MKQWLEDRETKWNDRHRDNLLWGTGTADMTAQVMATARVSKAAPPPETRKKERDETVKQDGEGLVASQHAGAVQDGQLEEPELQQQQKPKPRLQLKQQCKQQPEH